MSSKAPESSIEYNDFLKVDIRVGTIREVRKNEKARVPAFILTIDFGDIGIKESSAQIIENYLEEDLVGRQIVAVTNFPPKHVAGIKSEVLVLAAICVKNGTILLEPRSPVNNGSRIL